MKVPLSWLKEYVDIKLSMAEKELARAHGSTSSPRADEQLEQDRYEPPVMSQSKDELTKRNAMKGPQTGEPHPLEQQVARTSTGSG